MHRTMLTSPDAKPYLNGHASNKPTEPLSTIRGLIVTCSADCFVPELLTGRLNDGEWLFHRTPAAILPPFGVADTVEEQLIERVIVDHGIARLVICGHDPCLCANQMLTPEERPSNKDRTVRRLLAALPSKSGRIAAERAVLAQTANLLTHPAVAAAVASGRLTLLSWLYDTATDELLFPSTGETQFARLVALHPDHNAGLRREFIHRSRPREAVWVFDRAKLELA